MKFIAGGGYSSGSHKHRFKAIVLLVLAILLTMGINSLHNKAVSTPKKGEKEVVSEIESSKKENKTVKEEKPKEAEKKVQKVSQTKKEMRAVWVPCMSLEAGNPPDEKAFKQKFDRIIALSKEKGMNALIVHVRPFSDALYPSKYFPWSHVVGGKQGTNPGYDPLDYMVKATHKAGLEFHAWVNPLRIQLNGVPSQFAPNNPYVMWQKDSKKSDWAVKSGNGIYYNPAYPQVREYIANGVAEIVKKYPVDGVQFDDYFYPTTDGSFDKKAYDTYVQKANKSGNVSLSLLDWRTANINAMVSLVYQKVKEANAKTVFGIAPQCNISNDKNMGADVVSWCSAKGYVDYICPQVYVNFDHPVLPFNTAVETWNKLVKNDSVKLYLGLAVYKAGSNADNGTWKNKNDILTKEVMLGRKVKCDGFMFYSWDYLENPNTKDEVANVIKILK